MAGKKNIMLLTAAYERLSAYDDQQGERNSISNQKMILESYALKNALRNVWHFQDDGVSGVRLK